MSNQDKIPRMLRFLLTTAAIIFIIWGVSRAQSALASVLLSVFIALLATQPVLWLERKRVPAIVAVLIVVVVIIAFLAATGVVVGASVNSFYEALPQYQAHIQEQTRALQEFLIGKGIKAPDKMLSQYLKPEAMMNWAAGAIASLTSAVAGIVIIVVTVAFILLEATTFPAKLRAAIGDPAQAFPQFTKFVNDMKRYMFIKTLMSLGTGILVTALLYAMRVDFPVLWGFLAFLLNYVPSVGSTIAGIPAVLLALLQFGPWRAVLVAAGYVVINLGIDYGIEKRLMGTKLGLSTLVVFLSLIFWGSLLGPVGGVLCIPLTVTLKFAFEINPETRWIAVMLEPAPVSPKTSSPSKLCLRLRAWKEKRAGRQNKESQPEKK